MTPASLSSFNISGRPSKLAEIKSQLIKAQEMLVKINPRVADPVAPEEVRKFFEKHFPQSGPIETVRGSSISAFL
jgi:hypothetical protein